MTEYAKPKSNILAKAKKDKYVKLVFHMSIIFSQTRPTTEDKDYGGNRVGFGLRVKYSSKLVDSNPICQSETGQHT